MDRPFAESRPVGPFVGQSDNFSSELLGGNSKEVREDTFIFVEVLTDELRPVQDMMPDIVAELDEFVRLEHIGAADGKREFGKTGRETDVSIGYYHASRVRDSEVTLGQIEQFIQQELAGPEVFNVNVKEL